MDTKIVPVEIKGLPAEAFRECVGCPHQGENCAGANPFALEHKDLGIWIGWQFEQLGINNRIAAEGSGVSISTIARIRSGDVKDVRYSTMRHLLYYLQGNSWGTRPCYKDNSAVRVKQLTDRINYLETDGNELRTELAHRNEQIRQHSDQLNIVRAEGQRRVDFLKKLCIWLGIASGTLLCGLIAALVYLFTIAL